MSTAHQCTVHMGWAFVEADHDVGQVDIRTGGDGADSECQVQAYPAHDCADAGLQLSVLCACVFAAVGC